MLQNQRYKIHNPHKKCEAWRIKLLGGAIL
nr:MAG TPA_asm: hypothetical protein [Caudoviricetes sp.]DAM60294.1 MAG TPA: hypothetical protein [Caudoviricetes sp.]DAU80390.1 MAG TPA: hypothetical protein [Caudoviricetes sp.]DAV89020.1 MAG TPA: hypothetical protein [Caudoviricetes sp.]